MKICGIIAEYNPFHNGHCYQIAETVQISGATHTVSVMSGNYTQRGEPAFFDKFTRAKAAVLSGADLVLELPVPWAVSRAQTFALGGVSVLNSLGCVDILSFGSECGNINEINELSELLSKDEFHNELLPLLKTGVGFAKARQEAVEKISGAKFTKILENPNSTLGVEYCKAIKSLNSRIESICIKRKGAAHNSQNSVNGFASASYIRKTREFTGLVPDNLIEGYESADSLDFKKYEIAVLSHLRHMRKEEFAFLPDISEGLENRIYNAVRENVSLDGIISQIKTKRYSHARIRRIILSAFLGLRDTDSSGEPPYIRVLGFNEKGLEILRKASDTATKPIYTRAAELARYGGRCFELECRAGDYYALIQEVPKPCGTEQTTPVISK